MVLIMKVGMTGVEFLISISTYCVSSILRLTETNHQGLRKVDVLCFVTKKGAMWVVSDLNLLLSQFLHRQSLT